MHYLIGKTLKHSKSKYIHNSFSDLEYDYLELNSIDELANYDYAGLNVTIPYKEEIIPLLDEVDDNALRIKAVNTVVVRDGKKIGYNTDYDGFKALLNRYEVEISKKSCLILGTGGSSKTVKTVLEDLGASSIDFASRSNGIPYDELKDAYDVIVNTTPVGMYPNNDRPLDIRKFNPDTVVDIVFNPLRTNLLIHSSAKMVPGLYMLVYQAYRAHELFLNTKLDEVMVEKTFQKLLRKMTNFVIIGMPMCGKTTLGKKLARVQGREFIDTDYLIEEQTGKSIPELFSVSEEHFRCKETEAIESVALLQGKVISTGGGVIKNLENVNLLKQNGIIIYLYRSLSFLNKQNPKDRPLLQDKEKLYQLYEERDPLYRKYADIVTRKSEIERKIDDFFSIKWS